MSTMSRSEYDVISCRAKEPVAAKAAFGGITRLSIKARAEEYASARILCGSRITLDSFFAALTGAHAVNVFNRCYPELAVTNLSGISRFDDGIGNLIHAVISHENFHLDFRNEISGVFCTAVDLIVSTLLAISLRLSHRQSVDVYVF